MAQGYKEPGGLFEFWSDGALVGLDGGFWFRAWRLALNPKP